jgi:hypothetical protein
MSYGEDESYGTGRRNTGYGEESEGGYKASTYGDDTEGYGAKKTTYGDDEETSGYGRKSSSYGEQNEGGYGKKRDSDGDGIPDEFEKSQYKREDVSTILHRLCGSCAV